jgi:hypothetical protein
MPTQKLDRRIQPTIQRLRDSKGAESRPERKRDQRSAFDTGCGSLKMEAFFLRKLLWSDRDFCCP